MTAFEELRGVLDELADYKSTLSLLMWDQEVKMPAGGAPLRARQISRFTGQHHHKAVHDMVPLLEKAEVEAASLPPEFQRELQLLRREADKMLKLPNDFVMKLSHLVSEAQNTWVAARKAADFSQFEPVLDQLVQMKRQEAEYFGYEAEPYDALLDQYEMGMTGARVSEIFESLKPRIRGLLDEIGARPQVDAEFLRQPVSEAAQLSWNHTLLEKIGYDFSSGRLDLSPHPFTIRMVPGDVRITTMFQEDSVAEMLYSSVHEGGHAFYEAGLPADWFGLEIGDACSLSIHESQSRLWENNVARDLPFWRHFHASFAAIHPDGLQGKSPEDTFRAMNRVQPDFIRISSDELTYHFHIILRFEIERDLINGKIATKDLPTAWNERVKTYLGLEVPNHAKGVLQDIHWSHGSFGYFPTYSLGSMYAAQFMRQAKADLPGLESDFEKGEFGRLHAWLQEKVFNRGKLLNSEDLCTEVTGEPLNPEHFLDYARSKFGKVYGF